MATNFFERAEERESARRVNYAVARGYTVEAGNGAFYVKREGVVVAQCRLRAEAVQVAYALAVVQQLGPMLHPAPGGLDDPWDDLEAK